MSMFWEDAEVTKCPLLTPTQLSEICVTQPLTSHYHTLDNRYPNPFSYFSRDLKDPGQHRNAEVLVTISSLDGKAIGIAARTPVPMQGPFC